MYLRQKQKQNKPHKPTSFDHEFIAKIHHKLKWLLNYAGFAIKLENENYACHIHTIYLLIMIFNAKIKPKPIEFALSLYEKLKTKITQNNWF